MPPLMRILVLVPLLAACGKVADLRPAPGQAAPVAPLGARAAPTAERLLAPPTIARPDRIDDPLRRSEPRRDDPFDLPPPSGVQESDADDTAPIEEPDA